LALLFVAAIVVVAGVALGSAIAATHFGAATGSGRGINLVRTASGTNFSVTDTWGKIAGATAKFTVSSGTPAFVLVRFAADAECVDGHTYNQFCGVRAELKGADLDPGPVSF
jgi:hypothetical protein